MVSLPDQCLRSCGAPHRLRDRGLLATVAHRRGVPDGQTPVRSSLLCLWCPKRGASTDLGELAAVCGVDRSDRRRCRSARTTVCHDLDGDGLSRSVSFQSSLSSWPCRRSGDVSGSESVRTGDPEGETPQIARQCSTIDEPTQTLTCQRCP